MRPRVITFASGDGLQACLPVALDDSMTRRCIALRTGTFTDPRSSPSPQPASQVIRQPASKTLQDVTIDLIEFEDPSLMETSLSSGSQPLPS